MYISPRHRRGYSRRKIPVRYEPDTGTRRADIGYQLLVPRTIETDDRQIIYVASQTPRDVPQIVFDRCINIHSTAGRRPDHDLVHVDIGRVEQPSALGRGQYRDRVVCTEGTEVSSLEWIDRDVDLWKFQPSFVREGAAADFLPDVDHQSLSALTCTDHDAAAHRYRIHNLAHRFDGYMVRVFAIALAHRFRRFDRCSFGYTQKIQSQFAFSLDSFHPVYPENLRTF